MKKPLIVKKSQKFAIWTIAYLEVSNSVTLDVDVLTSDSFKYLNL